MEEQRKKEDFIKEYEKIKQEERAKEEMVFYSKKIYLDDPQYISAVWEGKMKNCDTTRNRGLLSVFKGNKTNFITFVDVVFLCILSVFVFNYYQVLDTLSYTVYIKDVFFKINLYKDSKNLYVVDILKVNDKEKIPDVKVEIFDDKDKKLLEINLIDNQENLKLSSFNLSFGSDKSYFKLVLSDKDNNKSKFNINLKNKSNEKS